MPLTKFKNKIPFKEIVFTNRTGVDDISMAEWSFYHSDDEYDMFTYTITTEMTEHFKQIHHSMKTDVPYYTYYEVDDVGKDCGPTNLFLMYNMVRLIGNYNHATMDMNEFQALNSMYSHEMSRTRFDNSKDILACKIVAATLRYMYELTGPIMSNDVKSLDELMSYLCHSVKLTLYYFTKHFKIKCPITLMDAIFKGENIFLNIFYWSMFGGYNWHDATFMCEEILDPVEEYMRYRCKLNNQKDNKCTYFQDARAQWIEFKL